MTTLAYQIKSSKMENQNEWLTIKQALKMLQITSPTTLYRFTYKYHIRLTKPLGRVYLNREDILAALADNANRRGI
jgi:predicted site-specific integrase-resolvase